MVYAKHLQQPSQTVYREFAFARFLIIFNVYREGLVCCFLAPIFQAACYNIRNSLLFCFISSITQYVYDLFTALYVHVNERRKCVNPLSDVITHVFHFFCLMVTYTIIRNESNRQYTDQLIRLNILCCIPDDQFSILSNSKQYESLYLFRIIVYSQSLFM